MAGKYSSVLESLLFSPLLENSLKIHEGLVEGLM
jgi:hypothetical protein